MEYFQDSMNHKFGANGPDVILEIGSRDLLDAIKMTELWPNAKIYSFEPNPETYPMCAEKAKAYPNITVLNMAISDVDGEVDFYIVGENDGGSSLLKPIDVPYSDGTAKAVKVQCRRLDSWLPQQGIYKVDAIWIDAQGVEYRALKSMGSFLKSVQVMKAEATVTPYYEGQGTKDELEQFLIAEGFEIRNFLPGWQHPYGEGDFNLIRK
jgi:hypothetical protein